MKKSRFTETQIVSILKEVDASLKVENICRKHGISNATHYNWKSKYGDMEASAIKKLHDLQDENDRLKKLFANLSLENAAPKDLIKKRLVTANRREAADDLVAFGPSIAQACLALGLARATYCRSPRNWRIADGALHLRSTVSVDGGQPEIRRSPIPSIRSI
jgi:putative transposase